MSSDAEELSQLDNDEEELTYDGFSQETAEKTPSESYGSYVPEDSDNNSLYNRCWQRAEHYVHEFIKEQDDKMNEDQTSSGHGIIIDDQEQSEEMFEDDYQQIDFKDRSDTEFSQLSQSSSDESKTYSQVYSEILEESKARQKKAENIRKVYNNSNSNRTKRWVENIGNSDIEYCTTDASDMESEENFQASDRELDYETLVKEQLEVIAQYQDDPLGSFRNCIEEYMNELQGLQKDEDQEKKAQEDKAKENSATNRSNQSNVISMKSYSQNLDFESKSSPVKDKDENTSSTEILRFEHCEIYHLKRSDKSTIKDTDNRILPTEEIVSTRSKNLETNECEKSSNEEELEDNRNSDDSEQYEEISSEQQENQQSEETNLSTDNSYEVEEPYSDEEWKSEGTLSDHNESVEDKSSEVLTRQNTESESESFFDHHELQKPVRRRRTLNKSERASNNSHKSLYLPTTSSCSRRIRNSNGESSDSSDNYYLSSKSLTSSISQVSRESRSVTKTPRTYEDRGCSPIKIKSSSRKKWKIGNKSERDYEASESASSRKTDRHYSQASTDSEDREFSIKSRKSPSCLRVYNLDKAMLEIPANFKGNAIVFDQGDELLDISLSDDETQIQAKLQASALSDRKKNPSSGNSSHNSLSSSIWSISSYEPSVRFHRRTESEDDDVTNPVDDSGPMTYKKHVARLAERALRNCTNYYNEGIKLNPQLDEELNKHVQMLYNSEIRFNRPEQQERQLQGCSDG